MGEHGLEPSERIEKANCKDHMKAIFTVFEDAPGYWFVPHAAEADAISSPARHRKEVHPTKISACRAALAQAVIDGATELHLHGMGSTTSIKAESLAKGIKPFVYHPSVTTKIAPFARTKRQPTP